MDRTERKMWMPVLIFCARVVDMSIGTVRLICTTRGHLGLAVGLGFVEITIWVCAAASVLTDLNQWTNVVAYAGGYATGSGIGMWLESKIALGTQMVTLISRSRAAELVAQARGAGMTVTVMAAAGRDGPLNMCFTIIPRRAVPTLVKLARKVDPDVVLTVEDVRSTTATRWEERRSPSGLLAQLTRRGRSAGKESILT